MSKNNHNLLVMIFLKNHKYNLFLIYNLYFFYYYYFTLIILHLYEPKLNFQFHLMLMHIFIYLLFTPIQLFLYKITF